MHVTNNKWHQNIINTKRNYCTGKTKIDESSSTTETNSAKPLTKKEQLKKAFKDYGVTIVVFHVGISLASLGVCYALVSG